ncbi:MAG TPA: hypothetical protein VII22_28000 [Streptosporangiaceae bacterium]
MRRAELVAAGALILAAVAVRVQGLPVGPIGYDEGWAMVNGRFLIALLAHPARLLHRHLFVLGGDLKSGHDLALGTLLAVGGTPEGLSWYSALAGLVMAVALAALAWRRWGAPAGAVAGVIGAAAPLSVLYGHTLLAEADGLAGLAIVLLLLDRWWDRRPSQRLVMLTVLAMLATLTINYRLLPALIPLGLVAGWLGWWYRRHPWRPVVRLSRLVLACLVPAAAAAALYLSALGLDGLGVHQVSARLHLLTRTDSSLALPFTNLDFYPRTLWEFAGPAMVVIAVAALAVLLWRRRQLDELTVLAAASLVGCLLFFSVAGVKAPRAIAVLLPFAALVIARAVPLFPPLLAPPLPSPRGGGKSLLLSPWRLALAVCVACLITGMGSTAFRAENGTGDVGRWLAAHPGGIVATRAPVFAAYTETRWDPAIGLDPAHAFVSPTAATTIGGLRELGARYVVVDAHALLLSGNPVFRRLVDCGNPAITVPDPAGWSRLMALEDADTLRRGYDAALAHRDQVLAAAGGAQTIRVYDLNGPGISGC